MKKLITMALIVAFPLIAQAGPAKVMPKVGKPLSGPELAKMQNQAFCKLKGLSDKMKKGHGCK